MGDILRSLGAGQDDMTTRIRTPIKLNGGPTIDQFWGSVSNIYLIADEKNNSTCLVDCGLASDAGAIIRALKSRPLRKVICTHFHIDHISGWKKIRQTFPKASIHFHEKARPYVKGDKRIPWPCLRDFTQILWPVMKEYRYCPISSFGQLLAWNLYGSPLRRGFPSENVQHFGTGAGVLPGFQVLHTPGHRPDAVCLLHRESGALISGDFLVVLNGRLLANPYLDDADAQRDSLTSIKSIKDIRLIFPGHGRVIDVTHTWPDF